MVDVDVNLSDDEVFYPSTVSLPKTKSPPGRLSPRRLWTSRSKSMSKIVSCSWNPQIDRHWVNNGCRQITLPDSDLLNLTQSERIAIRQLALVKLRALNLGCAITLPKEREDGDQKPKKRAILLKKRAATTGFFEKKGKGEQNKQTGQVFGIPLATCCRQEWERVQGIRHVARVQSNSAEELFHSKINRSASQASLSRLNDSRDDESPSSESLSVEMKHRSLTESVFINATNSFSSEWESLNIRSPQVPKIATECFLHIEDYGLRTVGIFRISSSKKKVRELREDFDSGHSVQLTSEHCPHVVSTLLKEYFRDLPEPLLTRELYPAFLATQKLCNRKHQLEALRYLIQLLPTPHCDTLAALLRFLAKVGANSSDVLTPTGERLPGNKMDTSNLATLFGPNILHTVKGGSSTVEVLTTARADERTDVINVVRTMIDNVNSLFLVTSECLHEVYLYLLDRKPDLVERLLNLRSGLSELDIDNLSNYVIDTINDTFTPPITRKNSTPSKDDTTHADIPIRRCRSGTPLSEKYLTGSKLFRRREKSATPPGTDHTETTNSPSRWFRSNKTKTLDVEKTKWLNDNSPNSQRRPLSVQHHVIIRHQGGQRLSVPDNNNIIPPRRSSSSDVPENPVISASLTLRVPALRMDDRDIPFIEDTVHSDDEINETRRRRPSSLNPIKVTTTSLVVHDSQDSILSSDPCSSASGGSSHNLRLTQSSEMNCISSGDSTPLSASSPTWRLSHSVPTSPRSSPSSGRYRRSPKQNWERETWKRWEIISSEHTETFG